MKIIYLKCIYETIIPDDYSNGEFYDGIIYVADRKLDNILEEFVKTKKIEMYPHESGALWSDPTFNINEKKLFDFSGPDTLFFFDLREKSPSSPIRFTTQPKKDGYKYHYWIEVVYKNDWS